MEKGIDSSKKILCIFRKLKWWEIIFDIFSIKVDLALLVSATILRKLQESDRLSDDADNFTIDVLKYKPRRDLNRLHNWIEDGDYEWGDAVTETVSAKIICNSLIHSYTYSLNFSKHHKFIGFFTTSDYDKNKFIYYIELDKWIEYIDFVSSDSICELSGSYDPKSNDYKSTFKRRGKYML